MKFLYGRGGMQGNRIYKDLRLPFDWFSYNFRWLVAEPVEVKPTEILNAVALGGMTG